MRPSLGFLAIAACVVHVSPVQAATCVPIARSPAPSGFHCGMPGTLAKPAPIGTQPTTATSVNACAAVCENSASCVSFGYAKGKCYLYSQSLDQQGFRPAKQGTLYYNFHCFACQATATVSGTTSTTSTTTIVSTVSTSTVTQCSTTVTVDGSDIATFIDYVSRTPSGGSARLAKRAGRPPPPKTTVATTTLSPSPVIDVSTSTSFTGTTVVTSCSTTSTSTVTTGSVSCGIAYSPTPSASTSGTSVTCASSVPTPSLVARFRIEGLQSGEGTIFEDCILSGPRNITTPSGGTHECDGTNNGANPNPGTCATDMLDAASMLEGFGYDGTFVSMYDDYFITSISQTSQGGNEYWGVLINSVYTPSGGCQSEINEGQEGQWFFNSFNENGFLTVSPAYAAAEAGSGTVTVTVFTNDGSGDTSTFSGASFAGQKSGSDGNVVINVPSTPGCYQYKAMAAGQGPSNAFYLNVVDSFSSS